MTDNINIPVAEKDLYRHDGFVSIYVCMTHKCNLACGYCYNQIARHGCSMQARITPQQARHIVEEVDGCDFIHPFYDLSGGEPMLLPDWRDSMEVFLGSGREVSLNTNGTLIDCQTAKALVALGRSYPDQLFLSVSLDSHDSKVNLKNRPGAASNNVYGAMDLLRSHGIRFRAAITLTNLNRPTIAETVRFIVKNYTREFIVGVLRPVFPMTSEGLALLVPLSDVQNVKADILNLQSEIGQFTMYHTLDAQGHAFCRAGLDRINIEPDGDVTACYTLQGPDNVVGNVFHEPLREIVRRLHAVHSGRDIRYLLCEHQGRRWGEVPAVLKLGLSMVGA